jgi:hypothetical protein
MSDLLERVNAFQANLEKLSHQHDGSYRGEILKILAFELRSCIDDVDRPLPPVSNMYNF